MLIRDKFVVKSRFSDYEVIFVNDFTILLKQYAANDSLFIIDQKVYSLYKSRIDSVLPVEKVILIDALEINKNIDYCQIVIKKLIEKNIKRNYTIFSVGGGIIQDITAFIASILYRGIDWIFIPTTLLAQSDSCIGSKTSMNLGDKKNLLGTFYPPTQIHIDTNFLETLSTNDIKSGIGEILHFYFYANSPLIKRLIDDYDKSIKDYKLLNEHIKASLAIKRKVIEIDEFDKDERNKFNYGHTFGHAIETLTKYKINHGQAVTMGMDIANYLSEKLGYMDKDVFISMHRILEKNIPELDINEYDLDEFFVALSKDKKNVGKNLVCILSKGPGRMIKESIPFNDKLKNIIVSYFVMP
jgi:3-dehydroquinate synthase